MTTSGPNRARPAPLALSVPPSGYRRESTVAQLSLGCLRCVMAKYCINSYSIVELLGFFEQGARPRAFILRLARSLPSTIKKDPFEIEVDKTIEVKKSCIGFCF